MKQLLTLIFTVFLVNCQAQTLFTYGKQKVDRDEFLRAFNKNNNTQQPREKAIREYLDLYVRFKLKVQAARDQKLDTLQQLAYDLQNFRSQVEDSYLNDEKGVEKLLDEAFERSRKDIHLLHFSVPFNRKASAEDTLSASKAIRLVREELLKGARNYDDLVDRISEEVSKVKGTDLGFITALQLPYSFENAAYSLKPGEVSSVIRTKTGLHVFKNEEERESAGRWRVAQILLSIPPEVNGTQLKQLEHLADSLYQALLNGADFASLVKQYSDDKLTYLTGGELPEFGTGKFELPFEKQVFALAKDGDFSKPIFTGFGFHIVKRLGWRPNPKRKQDDESFVYSLRQQLMQDARISIPKTTFTKEVLQKTGYKKSNLVADADLFRYADSVTDRKGLLNTPINNKVIFSFSKQPVKGSDWLSFVRDYKLNTDVYKGETNPELLDKYIAVTAMEYYRKHLESFNEDFRYQIQEFREGNMLFETMERNIWSKAASDSAGLVNYYNKHREKYHWGPSAEVIIFNAATADDAKRARNSLSIGRNWRSLADDSDGRLQADSGRFEISQLPIPAGTEIKAGLITEVVANSNDQTASFQQIMKQYPGGEPRSFEAAKGLVINDYQTFLEEQWIETLRKKYPVVINEAAVKQLIEQR